MNIHVIRTKLLSLRCFCYYLIKYELKTDLFIKRRVNIRKILLTLKVRGALHCIVQTVSECCARAHPLDAKYKTKSELSLVLSFH